MPSAASAAQRKAAQLASLTFFLDHQIGRYTVASHLRSAGAKVEVHLDHFPGDAADSDWIPKVAERGWVLITKDQNIRRNPPERAAYETSRLRGFVVTGKDMKATTWGNSSPDASPAWCAAPPDGRALFSSPSRAAAPFEKLSRELSPTLPANLGGGKDGAQCRFRFRSISTKAPGPDPGAPRRGGGGGHLMRSLKTLSRIAASTRG